MASPSPVSPKVETEAQATGGAGETSPPPSLPQEPKTEDKPAANKFGDHSSSYWPPGWDFNRYSQATGLELSALPNDQYPKLQAGLLDVLGDDGQSHLDDYLFKLARQRAGLKPSYPDWLTYLRRFYPNDQAWGFVGIQTTCFDDAARWHAFKAKLNDVVGRAFHTDMPVSPADVSEAKATFEIRWVEDPAVNSAGRDGKGPSLERLRERFKGELQFSSSSESKAKDLPPGISRLVFLVASQEAITSVMDASVAEIIRWHDPDTSPLTKAKRRGVDGVTGAPWILAVAADAERELDEEEEGHGWYKPVIKVAAENLADAFWHELDSSTGRKGNSYGKFTRFTRGVDLSGEAVDGGEGIRQDVWWAGSVPPAPGKRRRFQ